MVLTKIQATANKESIKEMVRRMEREFDEEIRNICSVTATTTAVVAAEEMAPKHRVLAVDENFKRLKLEIEIYSNGIYLILITMYPYSKHSIVVFVVPMRCARPQLVSER